MTHAYATPRPDGSLAIVTAAIDDWLSATAPTDDQPGGQPSTFSTVDIAETVLMYLAASGYRITPDPEAGLA